MNQVCATFQPSRRYLGRFVLVVLPIAAAIVPLLVIPTMDRKVYRPPLTAQDKLEQIVDALKLHAEAFEGRFPQQLYGDRLVAQVWSKLNLPELVGHSPRSGFAHLTVLRREEASFRYYGRRVVFGEGDRLLLHWSTQTDKNRVIFGDLTTRECSDAALAALLNPWEEVATNCVVRVGDASGVVISPDGLTITASHAVPHDSESVEIRYCDGRVVNASVVDRSVRLDVAILQCSLTEQVPFIALETDRVIRDELLWAIGYPHGSTAPRIREVSSQRYVLDELVVAHNRDVQGGDSGGALINLAGKLVGIVLGPGDGHLRCIRSASSIGIRRRWPDAVRRLSVAETLDSD